MKLSKIITLTLIFLLTGCATIKIDKLNEYQVWLITNNDMLYDKSYIFFDKEPYGGIYMGCNRYNFQWHADKTMKTIKFDNVMSTLIACHADYQEQENIEKLMRTTRYELIGANKMYLYDNDEILFYLKIHPKSETFFKEKYGDRVSKKSSSDKSQQDTTETTN